MLKLKSSLKAKKFCEKVSPLDGIKNKKRAGTLGVKSTLAVVLGILSCGLLIKGSFTFGLTWKIVNDCIKKLLSKQSNKPSSKSQTNLKQLKCLLKEHQPNKRLPKDSELKLIIASTSDVDKALQSFVDGTAFQILSERKKSATNKIRNPKCFKPSLKNKVTVIKTQKLPVEEENIKKAEALPKKKNKKGKKQVKETKERQSALFSKQSKKKNVKVDLNVKQADDSMSCKTTANIGNSTVKDPTEESLKDTAKPKIPSSLIERYVEDSDKQIKKLKPVIVENADSGFPTENSSGSSATSSCKNYAVKGEELEAFIGKENSMLEKGSLNKPKVSKVVVKDVENKKEPAKKVKVVTEKKDVSKAITTAKQSPESRPALNVSTDQECKKSLAKKIEKNAVHQTKKDELQITEQNLNHDHCKKILDVIVRFLAVLTKVFRYGNIPPEKFFDEIYKADQTSVTSFEKFLSGMCNKFSPHFPIVNKNPNTTERSLQAALTIVVKQKFLRQPCDYKHLVENVLTEEEGSGSGASGSRKPISRNGLLKLPATHKIDRSTQNHIVTTQEEIQKRYSQASNSPCSRDSFRSVLLNSKSNSPYHSNSQDPKINHSALYSKLMHEQKRQKRALQSRSTTSQYSFNGKRKVPGNNFLYEHITNTMQKVGRSARSSGYQRGYRNSRFQQPAVESEGFELSNDQFPPLVSSNELDQGNKGVIEVPQQLHYNAVHSEAQSESPLSQREIPSIETIDPAIISQQLEVKQPDNTNEDFSSSAQYNDQIVIVPAQHVPPPASCPMNAGPMSAVPSNSIPPPQIYVNQPQVPQHSGVCYTNTPPPNYYGPPNGQMYAHPPSPGYYPPPPPAQHALPYGPGQQPMMQAQPPPIMQQTYQQPPPMVQPGYQHQAQYVVQPQAQNYVQRSQLIKQDLPNYPYIHPMTYLHESMNPMQTMQHQQQVHQPQQVHEPQQPMYYPVEPPQLPHHSQRISLDGALIYDGKPTPVIGSASDVYYGTTFAPRYPRRYRKGPNALEIRAPSTEEEGDDVFSEEELK